MNTTLLSYERISNKEERLTKVNKLITIFDEIDYDDRYNKEVEDD